MLQSHLDTDLSHQTGCSENELCSPMNSLLYTILNTLLRITGLKNLRFYQASELLHNVISSQLMGIGPSGILYRTFIQKSNLQRMLSVIELSALEQVHKAADFFHFLRILYQHHISGRLSIFIPKAFYIFFNFLRTVIQNRFHPEDGKINIESISDSISQLSSTHLHIELRKTGIGCPKVSAKLLFPKLSGFFPHYLTKPVIGSQLRKTNSVDSGTFIKIHKFIIQLIFPFLCALR